MIIYWTLIFELDQLLIIIVLINIFCHNYVLFIMLSNYYSINGILLFLCYQQEIIVIFVTKV